MQSEKLEVWRGTLMFHPIEANRAFLKTAGFHNTTLVSEGGGLRAQELERNHSTCQGQLCQTHIAGPTQ